MGQLREVTPLMKKYIEHALKSELLTMFPDVRRRVMQLPVCPKCERLCLRDTRPNDPVRGYITCPICGYHGPTTMAARTYIQECVIK